MSEDATTTPATGPGSADELPDLRPIVATDEAAQMAKELRAEHASQDGALGLGVVTDEELLVCLGSVGDAQPMGAWFPALDERSQRLATSVALRSLISRQEVFVTGEDDELAGAMSGRLMGILRLRMEPVTLSAQGVTRGGSAWYLLRPLGDGQWLREIITEQGFHTFDLVRLDEGTEAGLQVFMQVQDTATPSAVDIVQASGAPDGDVAVYLSKQRNLTQLALQYPGEELARGLIVGVDHERRLTLGRQHEGGLAHRGAEPTELWDEYRKWVAVSR